MRPEFWKVSGERTSWFVPVKDWDATFETSPPYANDARPLRYVGMSEQPSGIFVEFEGASGEPLRVKRIEQNPVLVKEMFAEVFEAEFPGGSAGETVYGSGLGGFTDYGQILRSYQAAAKGSDLGTLNRSIQLLLEKKSKPSLRTLPPEQIKIAAEKIKASEQEPVTDLPEEPNRSSLWLIGLALLAGAALIGSGSKDNAG